MARRLNTTLAATLAALTHVLSASAAVEPPPVSDARSAALGGTGVAYSDNAAAVFHNPAGLAGLGDGAVTLSFSPFLPKLKAPIAGQQEKSERSFFPMFLVGGGYRLNDALVAGIAVYPVFGFGAEYTNLDTLEGEDLSMAAAAFEVSPALSYSITKNISIGLGYRATYMMQDTHRVDQGVDPNNDPILIPSDISLSGTNFLGLQAGVLAKVAKGTRLGLTYRNKLTIDLEGDVEAMGTKADVSSEYSTPHTFKLGIAQDLLDERLMLALDLKYAFYKDSSKEMKMTVEGAGETVVPMEWKDSIAAFMGVEYRTAPKGPAVRVGYSITKSAVSEDYPQPFFPPPGLQHAIHAGTGVTLSPVDLDLGGYYMFSETEDDEPAADAPPGGVGDYRMNVYVVALSATYRI